MDIVELIEPRADLEASHRSFVNEFLAQGEKLVPWVIAEPYDDFRDYIAMLKFAAKGVGLQDGWVAHSTFWLIDENKEIMAISNVRHALTDYLLKLGGHIGYGYVHQVDEKDLQTKFYVSP
ncbi:MAG: GNAT family N-acetyltransferase [Elusimicrobiota bacterium]